MADLEGAFIAGLAQGDTRGAVAALLDLDDSIETRIRAGEDSPDLDNASSTFRALIVRLGEAAEAGAADPRSTVDPLVETLLALRTRARDAGDYATADLIRDRLGRGRLRGPRWARRVDVGSGRGSTRDLTLAACHAVLIRIGDAVVAHG